MRGAKRAQLLNSSVARLVRGSRYPIKRERKGTVGLVGEGGGVGVGWGGVGWGGGVQVGGRVGFAQGIEKERRGGIA